MDKIKFLLKIIFWVLKPFEYLLIAIIVILEMLFKGLKPYLSIFYNKLYSIVFYNKFFETAFFDFIDQLIDLFKSFKKSLYRLYRRL